MNDRKELETHTGQAAKTLKRPHVTCTYNNASQVSALLGAMTDAGTDVGASIGTDVDAHAGTDAHDADDAGTDVGASIGTDVDASIGTDVGASIGTDTGADTDAGSGTQVTRVGPLSPAIGDRSALCQGRGKKSPSTCQS